MTERLSTLRSESGFTIIEVLVAGFVLVLGVLGVVTLVNGANASSNVSQGREGATNLARQVIEAARAVPYTDLDESSAQSDIVTQDTSLVDALGATGWQIRRRGRTYTVTIQRACSFDDASDGTAALDSNRSKPPFCPTAVLDAAGQANPNGGASDTQPDDYKLFTVQVSWVTNGVTRSVTLTSLINNPGSAFAPTVAALTANPPSPITTNPSGGNVVISATLNRTAASVVWTVDGVPAPTTQTSGSGISWSFTWNINNLVDGTYLVAIQAFKAGGVAGSSRTITMVRNLGAPAAPTPLFGGRNVLFPPAISPHVVELEWTAPGDNDLVGYSAWRVRGSKIDATPGVISNGDSQADLQVCPAAAGTLMPTNQTACQDTAPPGQTSTAEQYYVVAWDKNSATNADRAGTKAMLTVGCYTPGTGCGSFNRPPNAPTAPTTSTAGTTVNLGWTAASPLDPDGGSIRYYRVYRNDPVSGNCVTAPTAAQRIAEVTGQTAFTDTNVTSPQCYYVTAADPSLAESQPLVYPTPLP